MNLRHRGRRTPWHLLCLALLLAGPFMPFGVRGAESTRSTPQRILALRQAHSHNDYEHTRPLLDALDQGFTSVEADLHWIDGEIRVAHDRAHALPGRTLRDLYLEPLQAIVRTNRGRVHVARPDFYLMLDYKANDGADAVELHQHLGQLLQSYRPLLTHFQGTNVRLGAITVILSGSRPYEVVAAETERWWAIDGKPPELDSNPPPSLVPWISTSWRSTFTWNGHGPLPAEQRTQLRAMVSRVHAQGRMLRFWGAPDQLDFWRAMRAESVDLINTDQLANLAQFLRAP